MPRSAIGETKFSAGHREAALPRRVGGLRSLSEESGQAQICNPAILPAILRRGSTRVKLRWSEALVLLVTSRTRGYGGMANLGPERAGR